MPKCFECIRFDIDTNFNLEQLIAHLKFFHQLRPSDNFVCIECSHTFQSLKAFKKHFRNENGCLIPSAKNSDFLIDATSLNNRSGTSLEHEKSVSSHTLESVLERIETSALLFMSNLHSKSNFARTDVEEIISEITTQLLNNMIFEIENFFVTNFQHETVQWEQYNNILKFCRNPFKNFKTFHRYIKTVEKKDCYRDPKVFDINNEIGPVVSSNNAHMNENKSKGMIMPLKFQFKKFFELGDNLHITLDNMKILVSDNQARNVKTNIIHGEVWKSKVARFENKTVIPSILYYDDLEINNALGSHATEQSIAAFYYNFPTLPQHYLSSLDNIFVALLYKSKDSRHGNDACLNILIQEIKSLEDDGLILNTKEGEFHVYFLLSAVVGDNLGLNSLLGFTKSFKSCYPCRICKCDQSKIVSACKELPSKLRNLSNYNEDISSEDDVGKRIKLSGLREPSIFNTISSFHVTTNFVADIMHDFFEGVCNYDITQVLHQFIIKEKLFSLDIFNSRKQSFNLGPTEIGNSSPPIKMNHIQSFRLHMSASEMWTFCHTLPLLIGDLVPMTNEYWKLICYLIQLMDILLTVEFDENILKELSQKIAQHHTQYIKLFGETLKPKFHFLTHYPTIIAQMGPLRYIWCFRFEAKHRDIKIYTNNTNSRRNIPYTVGIKCSLKFCDRLLKKSGLNDNLEYDNENGRIKSTLRQQYYYENIQNLNVIDADTLGNNNLTLFREVTYRNTLYKQGFFLFSKSLKLYEIVQIAVETKKNVKDCYLICVEHNIEQMNSHFQSYRVLNKTKIFFIFSTLLHEFFHAPIHMYQLPNGHRYVRPKYY